jgi:uncharacterized protein YjbJ (UPF0337 family)
MQRTLTTASKNRFSRSDFRPDSLTFQGCGITDRLPARPAEAYRTRFIREPDAKRARNKRGSGLLKGAEMNQEQFGQFWAELKAPLRAKWGKITEVDITKIEGMLAGFETVVHERYGELEKQDVLTWANRRYAHWSGNYAGYKDIEPNR